MMCNEFKPIGGADYKGGVLVFKSKDIPSFVEVAKRMRTDASRFVLRNNLEIELHIQLFKLMNNKGMANVYVRFCYEGLPLLPVVTLPKLKGTEEEMYESAIKSVKKGMAKGLFDWESLVEELEKPFDIGHMVFKGVR